MNQRFELDQNIKRVTEPEHMLCSGLMTTALYDSASRAAMLHHHLPHSVIPINTNVPSMATTYEQLFGEYSGTTEKAKSRVEIISKINKFNNSDISYVLITYDADKNEYDIVKRKEVKNMAELFGFKYNNHNIDNMQVGDIVNGGDVFYNSPSIDEDGNFMYGIDANVVYTTSTLTIEDATKFSDVFAERCTFLNSDLVSVPINTNDVLLNLYGDKDNYQSLPLIGGDVKNSIFCATRRKNKDTDDFSMTDKNLRRLFDGDDIYQMIGDWKMVDIDLWSNVDIDSLPKTKDYAQLVDYLSQITNYFTALNNELGSIINSANELGHTYSHRLSDLYAEAYDYIDPNNFYGDSDSPFSNIQMRLHVTRVNKIEVGNKHAFRHGNKSVVSKIVPQRELGFTEDGIPIDVEINLLGVGGRMNIGQLIETDTNSVAEDMRIKILELDDLDDRIEMLLYFYDLIDDESHIYLSRFFNNDNISYEEKEFEMNELLSNPLIIINKPMTNYLTGDKLSNIFSELGTKLKRIKVYDPEFDMYVYKLRPMVVGRQYMLILKQIPTLKTSMRSKGAVNPRTGSPIKSVNADKKKILLNDQSNRIGEQELMILSSSGDYKALAYMYKAYSTLVDLRRDSTLVEKDSEHGYEIGDVVSLGERSIVVKQHDILTACMGYHIEIVTEDCGEREFNKYADIPDIPDEIIDMFL